MKIFKSVMYLTSSSYGYDGVYVKRTEAIEWIGIAFVAGLVIGASAVAVYLYWVVQ